MLQPLSEKSVAYFKQKAQEGKAVIFELDDAAFLQMDFRTEGFRLEEALQQAGTLGGSWKTIRKSGGKYRKESLS